MLRPRHAPRALTRAPPPSPNSVPPWRAGFGGGEATRDPEPTEIDPNDPKGKQKAIHKADSFEEYMKKRAAGNK